MNKILLNPGPTNTTTKTKMEQWIGSDVCHRTKDFTLLLENTKNLLLKEFGVNSTSDEWHVSILAGSGTTALESMISSLATSDFNIVDAGKYGLRARKIFEIYNIPHEKQISNDITDLVGNIGKSKIYFVENETSTGEKYDLPVMAERYPNARFYIDATSAFGATNYSEYIERIDAISFCANKCLQSTPGLGIVIWRKSIKVIERNHFLNLNLYKEKGKIPFTLPTQSVSALHSALSQNKGKKMDKLFDERKRRIISDFTKMGIECSNKNPSNTVIAFRHPIMEYDELVRFLEERGVVIYSGIPGVKKSFRVSTMSSIFDSCYEVIISIFKESLGVQNT